MKADISWSLLWLELSESRNHTSDNEELKCVRGTARKSFLVFLNWVHPHITHQPATYMRAHAHTHTHTHRVQPHITPQPATHTHHTPISYTHHTPTSYTHTPSSPTHHTPTSYIHHPHPHTPLGNPRVGLFWPTLWSSTSQSPDWRAQPAPACLLLGSNPALAFQHSARNLPAPITPPHTAPCTTLPLHISGWREQSSRHTCTPHTSLTLGKFHPSPALMPQKTQDLSKRHHNLNLTCNSSQFSNGSSTQQIWTSYTMRWLVGLQLKKPFSREGRGRGCSRLQEILRSLQMELNWSSANLRQDLTAQSQGLFVCQMGSANGTRIAIATEGVWAFKQT